MDFLFILKKCISVGLTPVSITIELVAIGALLLGYSRKLKTENPGPRLIWIKKTSGDFGAIIIGSALLFFYLCSIQSVAHGLSAMLEQRHPPMQALTESPEYIVVLPGGYRPAPENPAISRIKRKTFVRLVKGIEYWKRHQQATMVFTGLPQEVEAMKEIAIDLGVPNDKIIEERQSKDTKDHAVYLRSLLIDKRFILVTSANHMPRSHGLFKGQGLEPIAAPTDFHSSPMLPFHIKKIVPKANHLKVTDEAMHEFLGMGWASLRKQLDKSADKQQDLRISSARSD